MKQLFILACIALLNFSAVNVTIAQDADEIVSTYIETIGGAEKLASITSIKMTGKANSFGMNFPIEITTAAPGSMKMVLEFQGKSITQMAFDGETAWTTNFMTMEAEKMDSEQTAVFKRTTEFPDPLFNYKEKGYTVSLDGEKEIEGTACYKVKLNRGTMTIDDKEETLETVYYFDKETFVPIMQQEFSMIGEMKGKSSETYFSDYDEVDGYIVPFTMTQKVDGQVMMEGTIEKVELNIDVEADAFAFPEK